MNDNAGLAGYGSPGGKRGRDTGNEVEVGGPDAKNARTGDTNAEARNRTEAAASHYADTNAPTCTTRRSNPKLPSVSDEVLGLPRGVFCKSLSFLADAEVPSELLEISKASKSFRAAALDNIIWKEICDKKWKTKFGYRFRMERAANDDERKNGDDISEFDRSVSSSSLRPYPTAASDDIDCPKAGFWYHRYWNELKMSTVNRITLSDLTEPRWSIATWFLPPNPKLLPTYAGTGLTRPKKNGLRFGADGSFAGPDGNKDVLISDFYALLDSGTIVNTAWPGIKSLQDDRNSKWTFQVHRRLDWGWELHSQLCALRSYDEKGPDGLWEDYLKNLTHQRKEDGTPASIRPGFGEVVVRTVPKQMADKLAW